MNFGSLVQYDSSDESDEESNNENISEIIEKQHTININKDNKPDNLVLNSTIETHTHKKLLLPEPIKNSERLEIINTNIDDTPSCNLSFNILPQPKSINEINTEIIEEEDDEFINIPKATEFVVEKSSKKEKGPVKISIPSLSEFEDVDDLVHKKKTPQTSTKVHPLLTLLQPPKGETISTANLIPHTLTKTTKIPKSLTPTQIKQTPQIHSNTNIKIQKHSKSVQSSTALNSLNYDSNTDDEDEEISNTNKSCDFFSLSDPVNLPLPAEIVDENILSITENTTPTISTKELIENNKNYNEESNITLTSTVMNLPKNEILLKNKAEVGPKLPVPEQEYNIDTEGNVAFDDKAIEYLCGKRGVKRKQQIINENEIIDINGEDMKPDEREWLVKALTEEPVRKPVSLGSGPSSQSKKKHQITYLAHQAKAMEIELQNQWSNSNLARKQTRSKYGF